MVVVLLLLFYTYNYTKRKQKTSPFTKKMWHCQYLVTHRPWQNGELWRWLISWQLVSNTIYSIKKGLWPYFSGGCIKYKTTGSSSLLASVRAYLLKQVFTILQKLLKSLNSYLYVVADIRVQLYHVTWSCDFSVKYKLWCMVLIACIQPITMLHFLHVCSLARLWPVQLVWHHYKINIWE